MKTKTRVRCEACHAPTERSRREEADPRTPFGPCSKCGGVLKPVSKALSRDARIARDAVRDFAYYHWTSAQGAAR